jgi:hypothetical protein
VKSKFQYDGESALVSNMAQEAKEMESFPVLLGTEVAHFHRVEGGYNRDKLCKVVNLVHEVQGPGSPYRVNTDELPHTVEAHLSENFYYLLVDGIRAVGDYPEEDYVLSLKVDRDKTGQYSFSEPLSESTDRRETRHE